MGLDDLTRWHRAIFGSTFPHQAGQIRWGPISFEVRWRDDGGLHRRMTSGADPTRIREEIRAAFTTYTAELKRREASERSMHDALSVAATLYTDLLRTHPFDDGNLRASFPVLQGALVSLGAAPVEAAVATHDEAIGWALHPEPTRRTIMPFVGLIATRIEEASRRGRDGLR